jgi:hypothetical protein
MLMRRHLVLTDESARHPFRASLPAHWREWRNEIAEPRAPWRDLLLEDVRGFAQTYLACFLAISVFIA